MTMVRLCDFCGCEIRGHADRVQILEADRREVPHQFADYHDVCWWEVRDAIRLAEDVGGGLRNFKVASHQAIRAMRKRHRFPSDEDQT
jgi:hypothetical protein